MYASRGATSIAPGCTSSKVSNAIRPIVLLPSGRIEA